MNYSGDNAFTLDQLYLLCVKFIKEKEGKAFHLSYQDRLQLSANCKQVAHGPYRADASPGVGWLDVVGSARKATWQALGDLSRDRAQQKFVEILDKACPLLGPYLEAHLNEKREREQKSKEAEEKVREAERQKQQEQEMQQQKLAQEAATAEQMRLDLSNLSARSDTRAPSAPPSQRDESRRHQQEAQIRAALNQQTEAQFRQYAAEQHPEDAGKQRQLIEQLQEQHFHQYMTQVYQQQLRHQEEQARQLPQSQPTDNGAGSSCETVEAAGASRASEDTGDDATAELLQQSQQKQIGSNGTVAATPGLMAAPSMWSHRQVTAAQFKAKLAPDADAKLKIGPGEVVTVRVPTHEEGSCIVWEFATDNYDIGFGVYFEWTISPSDRVTVHISESSDEEDEDGAEEVVTSGDPDGAAAPADASADSADAVSDPKPLVRDNDDSSGKLAQEEIIPVYRRDCHDEVYCGSHQYPGRGVYLLKFDNSYSLWRSKWLYYRVYYTK